MMDHFCLAVGPEFFYTSLWQVLANAPSIRHYGTAFILSHLNKRKPISSQAFLFGGSKPVFCQDKVKKTGSRERTQVDGTVESAPLRSTSHPPVHTANHLVFDQQKSVAGTAGAAPGPSVTYGLDPTEWECHKGHLKKEPLQPDS
ncbi:Protein dopey-1 [Sparganum proliferum]